MKRLICGVLALVMVAALLTGCGEKKKLLGTWECTLDLSSVIRQMLDEKTLGGEFEIAGFAVTGRLTFLRDNTFRLELDQQKLTDAITALQEDLAEGLIGLLQEQLKEQGLDISVEELLTQSGLQKSDLTEQLLQSFGEESFLEALSGQTALEGFYKVKGDKLLLCADEEMKIDEVYTLYTVEENVLTLSAHVGENTFLGDNLVLGTTPVAFTKVS